ncbi:hypothetical protein [Pleionea mediterranea]|uniref:Citrate synthase n=1 Tax=Pleionea mediterranea TaxID=523701 RepID=A0A316FRD6_9GAMM|nr:hypothetical protein [Pleionea mediterranea]PWK50732.1 citrate synthase [Pleionea mediterranea]
MRFKPLSSYENNVQTKVGLSFLSERVVFRGKDLHFELKDYDWFKFFLFGITGKEFTRQELEVLGFIWLSTSYPDARIWCNRIAALAGSARTTITLGLSASMAVTEAELYGVKPTKCAIDFLIRANKQVKKGISIDRLVDNELSSRGMIYGYGRPLVREDERIPHVIKYANERGFGKGEHLKLALEIEQCLISLKNVGMNIAAVYAGLAADMGFDANEFHRFCTLLVFGGMPPCFIEQEEKPPGSFLPIRCSSIIYQGPNKRRW